MTTRQKLTKFCSWIVDLLFPAHCVLCKKTGSVLCNTCYQLIHFLPSASLKLRVPPEESFLCQTKVMAVYQPPISTLIKALKYQRVKAIASFLAWLLYLHLSLPDCSLITWVPANPIKLAERGFNQAELIAKNLAKLLNIPVLPLLIKVKHTAPQAINSWAERLVSQTDCFQVNPACIKSTSDQGIDLVGLKRLQAGNIVIIDDVITTGATLNECAKTLFQAGFKGKIFGVGVAHSSK
ncbi:MAG TPA: hypothetical protein PLM16_00220 [Candidatus Woesebacteria bacterium]|nr:hypothetical protein [Candidatus Woesebacteria bacterium]